MDRNVGWIYLTVLLICPISPACADVFESRAVVQVNIGQFLAPPVPNPVPEPARKEILENEIAVITHDSTLLRASQVLDLPQRWNLKPEAVVQRLRKMVTVQRVEKTDLLVIRTRDEEAKRAQQICNAVINAYFSRSRRAEKARTEAALDALKAELRAQENQVEEKRKAYRAALQDGQDVAQATQAYEASRSLLEAMKELYTVKVRALKIPRIPVTMHERPSKPARPIRP